MSERKKEERKQMERRERVRPRGRTTNKVRPQTARNCRRAQMVSYGAPTDAYKIYLATDYHRSSAAEKQGGSVFSSAPRPDPTTSHVPDARNAPQTLRARHPFQLPSAFPFRRSTAECDAARRRWILSGWIHGEPIEEAKGHFLLADSEIRLSILSSAICERGRSKGAE